MIADHDEIESSLAAFLLDAVDQDEADVVRTHVEGCPICQAILRRLQPAVNALPMSVDLLMPPARLREKILAAAAASREPARTRPQRARVIRFPRPRARLWSPGLRVTVAAAAVVAFALGAGLGLGLGRYSAPGPAPVSTVAQYSMNGSGTMSGAQGRVFELKQQGLTIIEFSDLPQLEQGKVYELWLISKDGHASPSGVFEPDTQGSRVVLVASNLQGVKAIAVTREAGPKGTQAPTQQPELAGSVG